jgi:hypothetical protein
MGDSSGDETNSPVIRVYDEAGNVIETHDEQRGQAQRLGSVRFVALAVDSAF